MIKKWNQFINESVIPGEGEIGSVRISLEQEEAGYFSEEPILSKLISDQKVALYDTELWYWEDDLLTINILKQYFPEEMDRDPIGSDEENESLKINESKSGKQIRIEKRGQKTYAFIEVVDGVAKDAKDIALTGKQREDIEKILNK